MKEKQKETVIPTTVMSPPEKEEEEEKDESDHDAFDPEEVKEIEAFKQRLQQRRELERSRSQKTDFSRKY